MPRKTRRLDRDGGVVRDASLIVIASEDTYAVQHYLTKFHTRRVQFKVLPTVDGHSSPEAVLERLDQYRAEHQLADGDELWACIDLDHWADPNHVANLRSAQRQARQKGYQFAISRPCFEFWILMHFQDPPDDGIETCADVVERLHTWVPGYGKKALPGLQLSAAQVEAAIDRASRQHRDGRKPGGPATDMHLLMRSLAEKQAIQLRVR